ncbi:WD-REPEATS-REGION domain-containing protein [Mycena kentingensis (nom. inval.)]|nr:WD-REPEATS-REGION domain-containing protein [Mycena kentingensis (nom. inval.)]
MYPLSIHTALTPAYTDSRSHPPTGAARYSDATRNVRLPRATTRGGIISKSEDGVRCVVASTESLRIVRVSDPNEPHPNSEHKSTVGQGGYRLDVSRNMWDGSGLKTDSTFTDVEWCHGQFNDRILTSARNGELIMWNLSKSGSSKYESKAKDHMRAVHKIAVSPIVHHYCITASADCDLRAWDIREMKSRMRIHHPAGIRGVAFSPSVSQPLQAVVGLDNGSIYRWDLRLGQRGLLDRILVAHSASVTSMDWYLPETNDDSTGGLGWIVSGSLDRTVKVWDVTHPSNIPQKPTYTLHPSFPVRRVLWRPGYGCEVAVVSNANAEFGSGTFSDVSPPATSYASALSSRRSGQHPDNAKTVRDRGTLGSGDAVEIFDVRRGWLAKWTVRGSASEGGCTDIAFRDSHAIWASHSSGMFSQIDLRDATKPVDAISRVAVTWEAAGTLAFVADRKTSHEFPYDDIHPGSHSPETRRRNKHIKAIGDPPYQPKDQAVGTYLGETLPDEIEAFAKLARSYVFEGEERIALCEINAQAAFEAGKIRIAQTWLLLASALTSVVPESPPLTSPPPTRIGLISSVSAPATITTNYAFPARHDGSPGHSNSAIVSPNGPRSSSTSRRLTPTSSNQSSPRPQLGALPPITPRTNSRPPFLGRRQSGDSGSMSSRRPSHFRRRSMSSSQVPGTTNASPSNTRHVGEGALDDSDSSSSGSTGVDVGDEMTNGEESSDNDAPTASPSLASARVVSTSRSHSHPSPLSKIAELTWSGRDEDAEEDEGNAEADQADDDASPSPDSADTDKSANDNSNRFKSPLGRHRKSKSSGSASSRRRSVARMKTRSRSSTLASLAAPVLSRTLVHQSSQSSIVTVTAAETSFQDSPSNALKAEETIRDLRAPPRAVADTLVLEDRLGKERSVEALPLDDAKLTERRMEFVHAEEATMHAITWEVLRDMVECFADEGDVQTCAILALVAPKELRISSKRVLRFLEAYIEHLSRLQLYSSAAYIRKFCRTEDVYNATLMETQIHTLCGKCRKPLMVSAGTPNGSRLIKGGFAFCIACQTGCSNCAICRLPAVVLAVFTTLHVELARSIRPHCSLDKAAEPDPGKVRGHSLAPTTTTPTGTTDCMDNAIYFPKSWQIPADDAPTQGIRSFLNAHPDGGTHYSLHRPLTALRWVLLHHTNPKIVDWKTTSGLTGPYPVQLALGVEGLAVYGSDSAAPETAPLLAEFAQMPVILGRADEDPSHRQAASAQAPCDTADGEPRSSAKRPGSPSGEGSDAEDDRQGEEGDQKDKKEDQGGPGKEEGKEEDEEPVEPRSTSGSSPTHSAKITITADGSDVLSIGLEWCWQHETDCDALLRFEPDVVAHTRTTFAHGPFINGIDPVYSSFGFILPDVAHLRTTLLEGGAVPSPPTTKETTQASKAKSLGADLSGNILFGVGGKGTASRTKTTGTSVEKQFATPKPQTPIVSKQGENQLLDQQTLYTASVVLYRPNKITKNAGGHHESQVDVSVGLRLSATEHSSPPKIQGVQRHQITVWVEHSVVGQIGHLIFLMTVVEDVMTTTPRRWSARFALGDAACDVGAVAPEGALYIGTSSTSTKAWSQSKIRTLFSSVRRKTNKKAAVDKLAITTRVECSQAVLDLQLHRPLMPRLDTHLRDERDMENAPWEAAYEII